MRNWLPTKYMWRSGYADYSVVQHQLKAAWEVAAKGRPRPIGHHADLFAHAPCTRRNLFGDGLIWMTAYSRGVQGTFCTLVFFRPPKQRIILTGGFGAELRYLGRAAGEFRGG